MRRKRYSKRPSRGKATSIASTSDAFVGDVARQQIGAPSSKTMLHESRASFLASQSSRLSCRSSVLSERPAKVHHKKAVPRAALGVGRARGGRAHPFSLKFSGKEGSQSLSPAFVRFFASAFTISVRKDLETWNRL